METGRRSEVHGQLGYIVSWGQAWLHEILSLRKSKQTKNTKWNKPDKKRQSMVKRYACVLLLITYAIELCT